MASFFKMAVSEWRKTREVVSGQLGCFMCGFTSTEYKEKIGLKCQFLIEPKPKEPCKHQYDYGTATPMLTVTVSL